MEVNTTNGAFFLVETNVVKPFKTGTSDRGDTMVGNQEVFFPAHKDALALAEVGYGNSSAIFHLLAVLPECREFAPVI